jgi:formylmethanofuran dehydrogenase subunit E
MLENGQTFFMTTEGVEDSAEDIARYKAALAQEIIGSISVDTNPPADKPVADVCDDCGDGVVEPGQGTTCGSCLSERKPDAD